MIGKFKVYIMGLLHDFFKTFLRFSKDMFVINNELDHFEEKICKHYTDFLVKKVGSG
jgi:hypothetical protein